jgi:hypothetical protein
VFLPVLAQKNGKKGFFSMRPFLRHLFLSRGGKKRNCLALCYRLFPLDLPQAAIFAIMNCQSFPKVFVWPMQI